MFVTQWLFCVRNVHTNERSQDKWTIWLCLLWNQTSKKKKNLHKRKQKNPPQPWALGVDLPKPGHLVVCYFFVISPNLAGIQLPINPVPPVAITSGPSRQGFWPPRTTLNGNHGGCWMTYIAEGLIIWQTNCILEHATKCVLTKGVPPRGTELDHLTTPGYCREAQLYTAVQATTPPPKSTADVIFVFVWGRFAPI